MLPHVMIKNTVKAGKSLGFRAFASNAAAPNLIPGTTYNPTSTGRCGSIEMERGEKER